MRTLILALAVVFAPCAWAQPSTTPREDDGIIWEFQMPGRPVVACTWIAASTVESVRASSRVGDQVYVHVEAYSDYPFSRWRMVPREPGAGEVRYSLQVCRTSTTRTDGLLVNVSTEMALSRSAALRVYGEAGSAVARPRR